MDELYLPIKIKYEGGFDIELKRSADTFNIKEYMETTAVQLSQFLLLKKKKEELEGTIQLAQREINVHMKYGLEKIDLLVLVKILDDDPKFRSIIVFYASNFPNLQNFKQALIHKLKQEEK